MGNYLIFATWAFLAGTIIPAMMIMNGHLAKAVGSTQMRELSPMRIIGLLVIVGGVVIIQLSATVSKPQ